MTISIYPQIREDFHFKRLNEIEYAEQFNLLINQKEQYLGFKKEKGFVYLSLVEKIIQICKGFLGFTNEANPYRLNSEWLKLLYVGAARGLLKPDDLSRLRQRISSSSHKADPSIRQLFQEIIMHQEVPSTSRLANMQMILIEYHTKYTNRLVPSFWQRLSHKPSLDPRKLIYFGDISLHFAQKALDATPPNPQLAFQFLLEAHHLKNIHPDFQNKLATQFKTFLDCYQDQPFVSNQESLITQIWLELAETAYCNHRKSEAVSYLSPLLKSSCNESVKQKIAKIYLNHKDYENLKPLFSLLQSSQTETPAFYIQIGQACWHYQRYNEGIAAYEKAAELLELNTDASTQQSHCQKLAYLYAIIGKAYFSKLEGLNRPDSPALAISCLSKACSYHPENLDYQQSLFHAYIQRRQTHEPSFEGIYGKNWIEFLNTSPSIINEATQADIQAILKACIEQTFAHHHNQDAHPYLRKGIELFDQQPNYILYSLEICLNHSDLTVLQKDLSKWAKQYPLHPFIQERIGDVYWNSQNRPEAVKCYKEACKLFEQKLSITTNADERLNDEEHIANLQAKIGSDLLQTEKRPIPYDEALNHLKKAARLNPSTYANQLFDTYLEASATEKQKTFFSKDKNKIAKYQAKAFKTLKKNGPYLTELMKFYLDQKNYPKALTLFSTIQAQTWADDFMQSNELSLSPEHFHLLAKKLDEDKQSTLALKCFEKACQLKPNSASYKKDFYQCALEIASNELSKTLETPDSEEKIALLNAVAEKLKNRFKAGFSKVEELKTDYRQALSDLYSQLAEIHIRRFLLPQLEREDAQVDTIKHREIFAADIQKTIDYYDKALKYFPDHAKLHFNKALVLDFDARINDAEAEYRLAVLNKEENALQTELFDSIPYDNIVGRLEKFISYHSSLYKANLSAACLEDSKTEKQKYFIRRDKNKIAHYQAKTFQVSQTNGAYLTELMEFYLNQGRDLEAVDLFSKIQNQTWADEFILTAECFHLLAKKLKESNLLALSFKSFEKACQLKPDSLYYKSDFYRCLLQINSEKLQKEIESLDSEEKIAHLNELAEQFKRGFQINFKNSEDLKVSYKEKLGQVYHQLAEIHIRRFLLPQPYKCSSEVVKEQRNRFSTDIQKAIDYYNKGLKDLPEDATLHFDKAMVLDFDLRMDEALKAYESAYSKDKQNPSYRKRLAFTLGVLAKWDKQLDLENDIEIGEDFQENHRIWYNEYFSKVKTQAINPHTY